MTPKEIHKKYPIRNSRWIFSDLTGRWVTDDSDFLGIPLTDPWNRPFPAIKGQAKYDDESELTSWTYQTTVNGVAVECVVFND